MFGLGITELLVILIIVLLLFGGNKLAEIGGGLGKAIRDFRREIKRPDEIDVTPEKSDSSTEKKTH